MVSCKSEAEYLAVLSDRFRLPRGFKLATTAIEFFPVERPAEKPYPMKLSLLVAEEPTEAFAATFTRNAFPGHPVILGRERAGRRLMQGVMVNNKISNVGAPGGLDHAKELTATMAQALGIDQNALFSASTGIIGWSLPVAAMTKAVPDLAKGLGAARPVDFAKAIMTTDRYAKMASVEVGGGTILGFAKGAGMIEPNMATMLVFIVTDIAVDPKYLKSLLPQVVDQSFNTISIDSDQSTSDMCLAFSSRLVPGVADRDFAEGLLTVCKELAANIVRNGEGTKHVIRCAVNGFGDHCRAVGKALVNSPLVKTAIYGNDPNVGRLVAAVGDYLGNEGVAIDPNRLTVKLWDTPVFANGAFRLDLAAERTLSQGLQNAAQDPEAKGFPEHDRTVDITISYQGGTGSATILGSDLGYEYVRENADYRS